MQSCGESDYYEGSKWECSAENFHDEYGDAINNAIVKLTNKYSIKCTHEVDMSKQGHILHYLYNDVFTYYFSLRKSTNVGKYSIALNAIIVICYNALIAIHNIERLPIAIILSFTGTDSSVRISLLYSSTTAHPMLDEPKSKPNILFMQR